jgi:hypothetical protein
MSKNKTMKKESEERTMFDKRAAEDRMKLPYHEPWIYFSEMRWPDQ